MIALFSENCVVGNVLAPAAFRGRDGARKFWNDYRGTFSEIKSDFRTRIESDQSTALEWTAEGTSPDGAAIKYDGITVLEFDGGGITRFHAYFDPRSIGRQMEKSRT